MSTLFTIEDDWDDKEAAEQAKRCPAAVNGNFVHRLARYDGLTVKPTGRSLSVTDNEKGKTTSVRAYALSKGDDTMTRGQFEKLMGLVAPDDDSIGILPGAPNNAVLTLPLREWACILMHPTFRRNLGLRPLPPIEEIKRVPLPAPIRKPKSAAADEISLFDIVDRLAGNK
jgi:hypothetical protein